MQAAAAGVLCTGSMHNKRHWSSPCFSYHDIIPQDSRPIDKHREMPGAQGILGGVVQPEAAAPLGCMGGRGPCGLQVAREVLWMGERRLQGGGGWLGKLGGSEKGLKKKKKGRLRSFCSLQERMYLICHK